MMLCLCLMVNIIGERCNLIHANTKSKVVYIDGLAYEYYFDTELKLHINCIEEGYIGSLVLDDEGRADVSIDDGDYFVDIEELNDNELEATVYNTLGEVVEEYDDIEDVINEEYEGQTLVLGWVTVIAVGTLVEVLFEIAITTVIVGVTVYAISEVYTAIKEDKKKKKLYYKAYLSEEDVYIDYKSPISQGDATNRIKKGKNIYTYTSGLARTAVYNTGLGVITESEMTSKKKMKKGHLYYWHWHTLNRNGAHSFFGKPYAKK